MLRANELKVLEKLFGNKKSSSNLIGAFDGFDGTAIYGWASTERFDPISVEVSIDDGAWRDVFESSGYRKDLEAHAIGNGNHSFNIDIPNKFFTGKKHTVTVLAIQGETKKLLGARDFVISQSRLFSPLKDDIAVKSHLDRVQGPNIKGWACVEHDISVKPWIEILIDQESIGVVQAITYREDLSKAGISDGNVAFSLPIPNKYFDGQSHSVEARLVGSEKNLHGCPKAFKFDRKEVASPVSKAAPVAKAPLVTQNVKQEPVIERQNYRANIDSLKNGKIICGWATDFKNKSLDLEVLLDDKKIGEVTAGAFRGDLKDAGINEGYAAFEFMPPANVFDGKKHTISLIAAESKALLAVRKDVEFKNDRTYKDYHEYLRWSFFNKEIYAPFAEEDKRVLSYMDWYTKIQTQKLKSYFEKHKQPLVSIVMPTYKRASSIGKAIESVIQQSYQNWELVIIDDGGNDGTDKVVASYDEPRIRYESLPQNQGVSAARNRALELAEGELICYLDSDNVWHSQFLLLMAGVFCEKPEFDTAYSAQYLYKKGAEKPYAMRYGLFNKTLLLNRNYIDMNCFMHRRKLYDTLGGFDQNLRRLVDWDMMIRYTEEKRPYAVPAILSDYFFNDGEETITVSESLSDALQGLHNKNIEQNLFYHLDHEKAGYQSDGGETSTPLTNISALTKVTLSKSKARSARYKAKAVKESRQQLKASIVIVSFNIPKLFKECLDSIIKTVDLRKTEIILVDNCSDEETVALLKEYETNYSQIKLHLNDYNYGFTHAVNQGIEMADPDSNIVLLNNDAIATEGWLTAMEKVVIEHTDVGIVAPQQVLLPKTRTMNQHVPFANPIRELDVTVSYHHENLINKGDQNPSHNLDVHFIPFFCVYITREIINTIGLLDAELGRHYRSDRLYCNAVIHHAKKRIVFTPRSKLYHLHQQSTSSLKKKNDKDYQEMFSNNKWSDESLYKLPVWEF